jgi:DNA transposition AAA+ family ATPase
MLWGSSHIGKTWGLREYNINNNHGRTVLVELQAVNGLKGLLQAWAVAIGVSPNANTPDLISRITRAMTPDMLVIFDEVHLLANTYRRASFFACMEQVRRIYDAVQFGMVFTYTELGFQQTEKERKKELMQIFRRGIHRVNLGSMPTIDDVHCIVEAFGLPWGERREEIIIAKGVVDTPHDVLRQLASDEGLKAITERIRLAKDLAADDEREEITWKDFLTAHYLIARNAQTPATGW